MFPSPVFAAAPQKLPTSPGLLTSGFRDPAGTAAGLTGAGRAGGGGGVRTHRWALGPGDSGLGPLAAPAKAPPGLRAAGIAVLGRRTGCRPRIAALLSSHSPWLLHNSLLEAVPHPPPPRSPPDSPPAPPAHSLGTVPRRLLDRQRAAELPAAVAAAARRGS